MIFSEKKGKKPESSIFFMTIAKKLLELLVKYPGFDIALQHIYVHIYINMQLLTYGSKDQSHLLVILLTYFPVSQESYKYLYRSL